MVYENSYFIYITLLPVPCRLVIYAEIYIFLNDLFQMKQNHFILICLIFLMSEAFYSQKKKMSSCSSFQ